MPAMVVRGRCQWEAFEKDLADALRTCEAPRLQPRRSALGFFPLPQTATHLAAAARALSADVAPAVLGTLLEECRRGGRHLSLSKAVAWEDMEQPVAEEEAPLEPWHRGRRASPEGSPSRGEALGWQMPGRPWVPCAAVALPGLNGGCFTAEATPHVEDKASSSTSTERPRSWSPNGYMRVNAAQRTAHPRGFSPSLSHDMPRVAERSRTIVSSIPTSQQGASSQTREASSTDDIGTEGSLLQASQNSPVENNSVAVASTAPPEVLQRRPPPPPRAFSSDVVLDIPTSTTGLRRTNADGFATPTSAITLAKLERYTVTSPFRCPQGLDLQVEAAECAICMDGFVEGEIIRTLPCCHRFHACCVDPWLVHRWQCPLCKLEVSAC